MNKEIQMVEMTPEQKKQYDAFLAAEEKKKRQEEKREQRATLQAMADEVIEGAVARLRKCSEELKSAKEDVMNVFDDLMVLRKEVNEEEGKREQDSFQFTSSDGLKRIKIGFNMNDGYLDQVNEGIAKVKSYIESLAKDEQSRELIDLVLSLLAKDKKGNLKASRVIQLGQLAEKSGDEVLIEGINIIREAYRPTRSKQFIRCSVREKGEQGLGEWVDVPLGITEV